MPPSLRRRAQQHHLPPPTEQQDDTDSDIDLTPRTGHDDEDAEIIGEDHGHLVALDDEEEEEELDEEDELGKVSCIESLLRLHADHSPSLGLLFLSSDGMTRGKFLSLV